MSAIEWPWMIESACGIALGVLLYYMLLRRLPFYPLRRAFLLAWPLLCLLVPLANFEYRVEVPVERSASTTDLSTDREIPAGTVTTGEAGTSIQAGERQTYSNELAYIRPVQLYVIGCTVFLMLFIWRLFALYELIQKGVARKYAGYVLLESKKYDLVASFDRFILQKKGEVLPPMVLAHELVHVRQRHSWDLLYLELLIILQWFNPLVYWWRRELRQTHEFIADASVIRQYGRLNYARVVARQSLDARPPYFSIPFATFIYKRLEAMKTKTTNRWTVLRYFILLPAVVLLLFVFGIKRVEVPKALESESPAALQMVWGDLNCNCYPYLANDHYTCDNVWQTPATLRAWSKEAPRFYATGTAPELLKPAEYTVTYSSAKTRDRGIPRSLPARQVQTSTGFFPPNSSVWKRLGEGDMLKVKARMEHGKTAEFTLVARGKSKRMIYAAELDLGRQIIPIDMSLGKVTYSMDYPAFMDLLDKPSGIRINNDQALARVSAVLLNRRLELANGSWRAQTAQARMDSHRFRLADHAGFREYRPQEEVNLYFHLADYDHSLSVTINLRGEADPAAEEEIRARWGHLEIMGTHFSLRPADIPRLKDKAPQIFLAGKPLPNDLTQEKSYGLLYTDANGITKSREVKLTMQELFNRRLADLEAQLRAGRWEETPQRERLLPGLFVYETSSGVNIPIRVSLDWEQVEKSGPPFIYPLLNFKLSSGFGPRIHPLTKVRKRHHGIDLTAPVGTPVMAAAAGKVVVVRENDGGYGRELVIEHANGFRTRYAQLQGFMVQEGDKVDQGQQVATVGSSGASTGPHLHFEILQGEKRVDPADFLPVRKE